MGIWERLRPVRYWIGGGFCPVGDTEILRRQQDGDRELAEQVRLLRQHREEDRRVIDLQALAIASAEAHRVDCDQRHDDLKLEVRHIKAEYFELFTQITGEPESPVLRLLEEEA